MNITSHYSDATKSPELAGYNDLLSIRDLSKIFSVSRNTIYKEIKAGKFGTPIQIGRAYKIPKIYVINKFFYNYG